MKRTLLTASLALALVLFAAFVAADSKPTEKAPDVKAPEFKLPPGWTEADAQACMLAGTPGKEQEMLLKGVGVWKGKNTMWHYPGAEPVVTEATCTITNFLDGRYAKIEWAGDMPGMGPYKGFGLNGYDNIAKKYVSLWIDNLSTGLLTGAGKLSDDGKTMTWSFDYVCPITRKAAVFRQVEKHTGANTKTMEMFGQDPKSGKEFKMMMIEMTRK